MARKTEAMSVPVDTVAETRAFKAALKEEIQGLARYLIEDPLYLLDLQAKMRSGTLHPMLQVALMNYAYGKPKERIEIKHAAMVRIVHEYAQTEGEVKPVGGEVIVPERPEQEREGG